MILKSFDILSNIDCQNCLTKLSSLQELFSFHDDFFFTVGLATYQHIDRIDSYLEKAKTNNIKLWNTFPSLYSKIRYELEEYFSTRVCYAYEFSIPGFHVFNVGKKGRFDGGSPHFDLSFTYLPFDVDQKDVLPEHYSFTLVLQLPSSPTGIVMWDLYYQEALSKGINVDEELCNRKETTIIYQLGKMYLFNGYQYHKIAPIDNVILSDNRITLQGHIIRIKNSLIIYW